MSEKKPIYPYQAYSNVIEWLYTNHDSFDSRNEWREALCAMLREELNIE